MPPSTLRPAPGSNDGGIIGRGQRPIATRRSSFRLTRNLAGAVVLLTALVGWAIGYSVTRQLTQSADQAARDEEIHRALRRAVVALSHAAAAARDTQPDAAGRRLDDYRAAVGKYRDELTTVRQLVRDEPDRLANLDAAERLVSPRLAALEAAAAGKAPPPAMLDWPLDEVSAREQALADGRARGARTLARRVLLVQTINAAAAILTILGGFLLFNLDVTRQERDEARLLKALRDADAANEAKTRFLANVSHEIRTPLNAVTGMSELLLDARLDPEQAAFARAVHDNAEALSMLIGDLLDSSRIEAGQMFLDAAPFDVRELVEGVAELLAVRAEAKGVDLIVDVRPTMPRRLIGDRARLRQVLMNLVGNAVKFTGRGEVTVRADAQPAREGQVRLVLTVIDTGIGIAPEAQTRIFERFVQADKTTGRRYGGTGLGLNISRSLIALMGGRMTLQSEPGHGSTFEAEVTLPLAPTQPAPDITPASLAGVEVLLVQGSAAQRCTNEQLLRFAGASVRAVGSAAEASAAIRDRAPRVLAAGERLPDATGLELAKQVYRDRYGLTPGVDVVLLCSLRAMVASNIGSYGIAACVYEPVKQARLVRAVREAAGLDAERITGDPDDRSAPAARPAPVARILLVEDDPDNWARAMRLLGDGGYDVDHAEDGAAAVATAAARDYDLILMDVDLPGIDGIEATRRIRAREAESGGHVPIVALTAHAVDSLRQEALGAGMDDYATKPIERQQLLDLARKWADRRPRVLAADDTPANQLLVATYLRGRDLRLTTVVNGQEAVEAFERRPHALVLLDMNMPVMDGYQAAQTIRRLPGGATVPILALTSYDGPDERERCLAAGCTDLLSKPVRRAAFVERVQALLDWPHATDAPAVHAEAPATLPPTYETGDRIRRLLARRDFEGLAALAASVGAVARARQQRELASVSAELVDAARVEDAERSAWWGDQLVDRLDDPPPPGDGPPDGNGSPCDALARLATLTLGVPVAAITLADGDRVRIAGAAGLPDALDVSHGFPRSRSLTRVVMEDRRALFVQDARSDSRLAGVLPVAIHDVAAMAGVPLTDARGQIFGVFLAMDDRPRPWPPHDVALLEELAQLSARMLAPRRAEPPPAPPVQAPAPAAATAAPDGHEEFVVDDDIADLLPNYVAARRRDVATLRERLDGGDLPGVARLAHQMKGSGDGYGLPMVSRLGKAIEDAARAGDAHALGPLIHDLDRRLAKLRIRTADGRISMEL